MAIHEVDVPEITAVQRYSLSCTLQTVHYCTLLTCSTVDLPKVKTWIAKNFGS
jgi:hypothetical protein